MSTKAIFSIIFILVLLGIIPSIPLINKKEIIPRLILMITLIVIGILIGLGKIDFLV